MSAIIYNKQLIPEDKPCIRVNDRGLALGHGLFETILCKKNVCPALNYHWSRLKASAPILGITLPFTYAELESMLSELIIQNQLQAKLAAARVTITHGESSQGIVPTHPTCPNFFIQVFAYTACDQPYTTTIVNTRKNEYTASARVKSISYIDNILAKQEALNKGYDEAILLNTALNIADGSISNVFMVKDQQIITPPIEDGALPGVVRAMLIKEFPILEQSISPKALMNADEIFLSNALMGIKPVKQLDTRTFSLFPVTNQLKTILREKKNYI